MIKRIGDLKSVILVLVLALVPSQGQTETQNSQPIVVFAAASLTDVLLEAAAKFKVEKGGAVQFNFGGSKALSLQIEKGAPGDLFIAADHRSTQRLFQKSLLATKPRNLFENRLVIVAGRDVDEAVTSLFDLRFERVDYLAIADPQTAPAGEYAMQALSKAGLTEKLRPFIVPTLDVRSALALVSSGNAKYAFVYATDALTTIKVRKIYEVPRQTYDRIIYTGALLKGSSSNAKAQEFLDFLMSPWCAEIIRKHGFYAYEH